MRALTLFICVSFISLTSCDKESSDPLSRGDKYTPKYTANELRIKFEAAYSKGKEPNMLSLFKEWNSLVKPHDSQSLMQHETVSALYNRQTG
jgi:hypothetical protein